VERDYVAGGNQKSENEPYVWRWLLFGAFLAVLPIAIAGLANELTSTGGFWAYVQRGDLLLVSVTLGGTAFGELIGSRAEPQSAVAAGGAVVLNAFAAAILYPFISVAAEKVGKSPNSSFHPNAIVIVSIISLAVTLIAGVQCVRVARKE
jgi:hypothetical protein